MKSALILACSAALSHAVSLQQEGYVIDLCPSEEPVAAIRPSATYRAVGSGPWASTQYQSVGGDATWTPGTKWQKLGSMYQTQELLDEGVGSFESEQACWQQPASDYRTERLQKLATMERLGELRQNLMLEREQEQQFYVPGATERIAYRQMIAPAAYNLPVGIIEREQCGGDIYGAPAARIPGAFREEPYYVPGYSFVPDSYTPGTYEFDASCTGQAVTVYPEREQKVLWCGERNLQGNQTLKRTNIHHNYVHDINHEHNYHNRTTHAARQFNTQEKDCSCKGVGVEAIYKCPPGIEAAASSPVGEVIKEAIVAATRKVGSGHTYKVGTDFRQKVSSGYTECECNKPKPYGY